MTNAQVHKAVTHSQLHHSLSEPLLVPLLFLRSSWCAAHTVGNEWEEKSTHMKAGPGWGSLVDWEGLCLTLRCLIFPPVEKSVSSLTDDGYIPRRFDSQGRNQTLTFQKLLSTCEVNFPIPVQSWSWQRKENEGWVTVSGLQQLQTPGADFWWELEELKMSYKTQKLSEFRKHTLNGM